MLTIWPIRGQLIGYHCACFIPWVLHSLHDFWRHFRLSQNVIMSTDVYAQCVYCPCNKRDDETGSLVNKPQQGLWHNDIWWSKVIMTLSSYYIWYTVILTILRMAHCKWIKKTKMFHEKMIQYMPLPSCFIIPTQYPIMSAYLGQTQP